ncbi:MAG: hypothetical protein FWE34_05495 [Defluviitaleaceae bacterium]|nr:hypothetical protein [Defluviitaleaceae bacterium]
MKKFRKSVKWYFITVTVSLFSFAVTLLAINMILLGSPLPRMPRITTVQASFDRNIENITIVRDFLAESNYEIIRIHNPAALNSVMSINYGAITLPIHDSNVQNALMSLAVDGYSLIGRTSEGIFFLKWRVWESDGGIIYMMDGNTPDETVLRWLISTEPLVDEGWHFYIEDVGVFLRNRE